MPQDANHRTVIANHRREARRNFERIVSCGFRVVAGCAAKWNLPTLLRNFSLFNGDTRKPTSKRAVQLFEPLIIGRAGKSPCLLATSR